MWWGLHFKGHSPMKSELRGGRWTFQPSVTFSNIFLSYILLITTIFFEKIIQSCESDCWIYCEWDNQAGYSTVSKLQWIMGFYVQHGWKRFIKLFANIERRPCFMFLLFHEERAAFWNYDKDWNCVYSERCLYTFYGARDTSGLKIT